MKYQVQFTNSEAIRVLRSYFQLQQGSTFHYTSHSAAESMEAGETWITRADCLDDQEEIKYGLRILEKTLGSDSRFSGLPDAIEERLKFCYVLSLSGNPDSEYLRKKYASPPGAILEFKESLSSDMHNFRHVLPTGDGAYRNEWFQGLYVPFDGGVIYDSDQQQTIVSHIVDTLPEILEGDPHPADYFSFITRDLVLPFLLFKRSKYAPEDEYRVVFIRKDEIDESFEHHRNIRGKQSVYIKAIMSPRARPFIIRQFDD